MINIEKYQMHGIEFRGNHWEFVNSLVYLKYERKINILELGEGNYPLLFAIAGELFYNTKKILSVDIKNLYKSGDKEFYEKKRIFSAIANRGYEYVEHFQGDCFANDILHTVKKVFNEDPIQLLIIEYMNNDQYMNSIFDTYEFYFDDNIDIYYHNLNKNADSIKYFEKLSSGKKKVLIDSGSGIGIVKIEK